MRPPPLPPKASWRLRAFGVLGLALLTASFATLDLRWGALVSPASLTSMGRFLGEFFPPDTSSAFVARVARAAWETLAMSALGTLLAALLGIALALPASRVASGAGSVGARNGASRVGASQGLVGRKATRTLLNVMRAIPELVWASLLLIAAGLGPFAGTLALALHTAGVLGRLYAEAIENAPPAPGDALRAHGVGGLRVFLYATLPQIVPQLVSYTLYRWENNIRAAAVLGVVGAGGLGQLLAFHMGLFQMGRTATILVAMLLLVAIVDAASYAARRAMMR